MMNYLTKGDVLRGNEDWLVIDISDDFCLFILLQTSKTRFRCVSTSAVLKMLEADEVELVVRGASNNQIVSFVEHGASGKVNDRLRSMAQDVLRKDKDLFWLCNASERVKFITETAKKYEISKSTMRRFLRDYLQNNLSIREMGCKYFKCGGKGKDRVFEEKRAGRKGISQVARTKEVVMQFEVMKKRYLKSKARVNFASLYEDFCRQYYCEPKIVDGETVYIPCAAAKRPTKNQLYYYIKTHLNDVQIYEADYGIANARNNIRALHSDTIADLPLKTIGTRAEMDEMETDFYLVSRENPSEVIGRAVLYVLVDVYSKIIMGVSVGVENNSWDGAKMALYNMVEDKVKLCKRAGISISENDWPISGIVPSEIEVDNGSEYLGNKFEQFISENGIHLMFVPPRMGSLKPNVEQKFHQFNQYVKGRLPGEITTKDYGSPYVKGAILTIEDFYKIVLHFVVTYNKTPLTTYAADKDVYEAGIIPSPLNIWNYKLKGTVGFKRINSMEQFKYSLLTPGKAVITRQGIEFKKIIYTCENLEWLSAKQQETVFKGRQSLEIRYDKRNMDFIYFVLNGKFLKAWINPAFTINEKYHGRTYQEIETINHNLKLMKREIEERRLMEKIKFNDVAEDIVKVAKKRHKGVKNSTKNIRDNRSLEKKRLGQETQIYIKTDIDDSMSRIPDKEQEKKKEDVAHVESKDVKKMSRAELFAYMENEKLRKLGL